MQKSIFCCVKSYMWILLFPVLVLAIVILEPDMNSLYGTIYCLFGGLVLSSLPFTLHDPRQTGGFTRLLPARQGDDIKGHFLFSFLFLLLFLILSLPAAGLGGLFKGETAALLSPALYMVLFSFTLLFAALQNLLFCILHTNSQQAQQLIRMAPPFLFFFGGVSLLQRFPDIFTVLISCLHRQEAVSVCWQAWFCLFWPQNWVHSLSPGRRDDSSPGVILLFRQGGKL